MTIVNQTPSENWLCNWFVQNELKSGSFPAYALESRIVK